MATSPHRQASSPKKDNVKEWLSTDKSAAARAGTSIIPGWLCEQYSPHGENELSLEDGYFV